MNIIWLGHGSFRIEIEDQVVLVDPWLNGNPMLPEDQHAAATKGATHILVTHGHFDHIADVVEISKSTGAPVSGMYELALHLHGEGAVEGNAFNMGGTISIGDKVRASMVPASHSSAAEVDGVRRYMGNESGFVLKGEGRTIYISGDTGLMADMTWIGDYHKPDIGILSAGGHFTMDMDMAAYAARTYFDFKVVIPCHYRTFDALEQSAQALVNGVLPGTSVIEPEVMQPISL
ncbi:metal-dependent hydrolase [uncultured Sulfitobacter sp.]|uniref:metal-dependent hydrolase n=1 Tax=uncultured Sulfitobacter sp. TaxID=191468 RepID=UPI00261DF830|nr:metal-dependent hydrolase [uncultured Sulfitobacter sp.]